MPSGPPDLHEKWCNFGPYSGLGDSNALHYLAERGLRPNQGGIFMIPHDRITTDEENSALDYLFLEWDYGSEIERCP